MVIKQVIKKMKHTATIVENGKLAVEEILNSSKVYDLVLMDIQV
jgi:CheY-like chemotaxis protein